MNLDNYQTICDAIVKLFAPLAEAVIHDTETDTIIYIAGELSGRKIADASMLALEQEGDIQNNSYPKLNFDGRLIKSISIPLSAKYLLCLNCDVTAFSQMQQLSNIMLRCDTDQPPAKLFANDWQHKLNITVQQYLDQHRLTVSTLSSSHRKTLIKKLYTLVPSIKPKPPITLLLLSIWDAPRYLIF